MSAWRTAMPDLQTAAPALPTPVPGPELLPRRCCRCGSRRRRLTQCEGRAVCFDRFGCYRAWRR